MVNKALLLVAFALTLCGCGPGRENDSHSLEYQVALSGVSEIACTNVVSDRKFKARFFDVCGKISGLTNQNERVELFRRLSQAMRRSPSLAYSERDRLDLAYAFMLPHEYISYNLLKSGVPEQEVEDFIINEFKIFRQLCHPTEVQMLGGEGDSRARQPHARFLSDLDACWRNDMGFFERNSIRTIFDSTSPGAKERFLKRWHDEFGCFDPGHGVR